MGATKQFLAAAAVASLVCAAACRPGEPTATGSHAPARGPVTSPALSMLPPGAPLAVWAKSPRAIAHAIRLRALVNKYPSLARAARTSRAETGLDLLDPDSWREAGIDPDGPSGFALLVPDPETTTIFVSAKDPGKFEQFVAKTAARKGEKVDATAVGAAKVLSLHGKNVMLDLVRFVIRGHQIFTVAGHGAAAQAHAIATVTPGASLAGSERFRGAVGALAIGTHIAGYADLRPLLGSLLGGPLGSGEEALLAMDRFAFGVDLDPHAIHVEIIGKTSAPKSARVLRNRKGVPAVMRTTRGAPLLVAAASFDPVATERVLESKLGSAWMGQAKQALQSSLHIDLDKEVIPLLTGDIGFSWTSSTPMPSREHMAQAFDLTLLVGVTSGARARALLRRLFAAPPAAAMVHKQSDGWYEIPAPDFKPFYLGVAGKEIVVSSDRSIARRLRSGRSFADEIPQPALRRLLSRQNTAALLAIRSGELAWLDPDTRGSPTAMERLGRLARDTGMTAFSVRVSPGTLTAVGGQFFAPGHTLPELIDRAIGLRAALRYTGGHPITP